MRMNILPDCMRMQDDEDAMPLEARRGHQLALGLALQTVMSHHVGDRNQTWILQKSSWGSSPTLWRTLPASESQDTGVRDAG